jgi:putative ABC transport system permease protein
VGDASELTTQLATAYPQAAITSRAAFSVQVSDKKRSLNCRGLAITPASYLKVLKLGELQKPPGNVEHWMWIGSDLATAFGVKAGDVLSLQAKTKSGTRNALTEVVIAGIVSSGHPIVDGYTVFVPDTSARELLDIDDTYATELLVRFPDPEDAFAAKVAIEKQHPELIAETWREKTEYIVRVNDMRRVIFNTFTFVIMLMAAAGVANTTLMSGFERITEIGALLALGLSRRRVMGLFVIEAIMLGVVGVIVGLLLGGLPANHFEHAGIPFPRDQEMAASNIPVPPVLYLDLTSRTLVIGAVLGLGVAVVAALYPAWKLSRTDPIHALKVEG